MTEKSRHSTMANAILSRLSDNDWRRLEPHLEPVDLPLRMKLESCDRQIEHVYFLAHGLASVIANAATKPLEIGIIGREGMTGLAVLMAKDRSPHDTMMQVDGDGLRVSTTRLRPLLAESASMRDHLLRYGHAFVMQMANTAVAHGHGKIEERLARWLLLAQDRLDGDTIPITHEALAALLGVRRPGVTVALKLLEGRGLVQTERRAIVLIDRDGLREATNGIYRPELDTPQI